MKKVVQISLQPQRPLYKLKRDGGLKETAYLMSTKANREHLEASIAEARSGRSRYFKANDFDLKDLFKF